MSQKANYPFR